MELTSFNDFSIFPGQLMLDGSIENDDNPGYIEIVRQLTRDGAMTEDQLKALLVEVRVEAADLDRQLQELRRLEMYLARRLNDNQPTLFGEMAQSISDPVASITINRFSNLTQVEIAQRILKNAGTPLNTSEIVARMIAEGYPERGDRKQLINSVFSVMRRHPETFRKVSPGTWWIADRKNSQEKE